MAAEGPAFFRVVLEHAAAQIVLSVLGSISIGVGLTQTGKLEDAANWKVWLPIAVGVALISWVVRSRWLAYQRLGPASGKKITLLIAKFDGDDSAGDLRETVRDSIKRELGDSVEIFRWPDALIIKDGADEVAEARALKTAHKWLRSKRCDLLIWGRVKGNNVISLRFTPAEQSRAEPQTYVLTSDTLDLPTTFISDLGIAIAAYVASSVKSATESKGYMVPTLRALADRLDAMTTRENTTFDSLTRAVLIHSYARVKSQLFDQIGEKADLDASISLNREALTLRTRSISPDAWAASQNNLGLGLARLGGMTGDVRYFDEAVVALEAALLEHTREKGIQRWAGSQLNLAGALTIRGRQENSGTSLEKADQIYESVVSNELRASDPTLWALAQTNRGLNLTFLADREIGDKSLNRALYDAFAGALEVRTREMAPFDWADTKIGFGAALIILGERTYSVEAFREASVHLREALSVVTRDRSPYKWTMAQNNLGIALTFVGVAQGDRTLLHQAVSGIQNSLTGYDRLAGPADWARAQRNFGRALMYLGELEEDRKSLERAIGTLRAGLAEIDQAQAPRIWTAAMADVGVALFKLGELNVKLDEMDAAYQRLLEARSIFDLLLKELTVNVAPMEWVKALINLGSIIRALGELKNDTALLDEAVGTLRRAFEVISPTSDRIQWAVIHFNVAKVFLAVAERETETEANHSALCRDACHEALGVLADQHAAPLVAMIKEVLAHVDELELREFD